MMLDSDALIERRRLRRRLVTWRVVAGLAILGVLYLGLRLVGPPWLVSADHVARLSITGVITEDSDLQDTIDDLIGDDSVKAVIVYINSPGGSTYGGEDVYRGLRRLAQAKPVAAVIGTLGASAGYMVALAADRMFARENSITGSIGVLFQTAEFSGLLDKIGINPESVTSGPMKDEPSPFRPMSDAGRRQIQALVDETHAWFVDLVAERRRLPWEKVAALADGRVYTGRSALELGLIDQLGAEREARAWLAETHDIDRALPLRDREYGPASGYWPEAVSRTIRKTLLTERLTLDGLVSVWHPER